MSTALEEVRVAQEQIIESRARMEQLQEQLRRQAERYWQLFDEIPAAVRRHASATRSILEVNKAGAELFNVSQRFLIGKTLSVFVCEDRTHSWNQCARFVAEPTAIGTLHAEDPPARARAAHRSPQVNGDAERIRCGGLFETESD